MGAAQTHASSDFGFRLPFWQSDGYSISTRPETGLHPGPMSL